MVAQAEITAQVIARDASIQQNKYDAEFSAYYDSNFQKIYMFVLSLVGTEQDAADLTQNIFLSLFQSFEYFTSDKVKSKSGYLYRISKNKVADFFRVKYREPDPQELNTKHIATELGPESQVVENEFTESVQKGLSKISDVKGTVLRARYYDEHSYAEIARALNIEENAVKQQIFRAKASLKVELESLGELI